MTGWPDSQDRNPPKGRRRRDLGIKNARPPSTTEGTSDKARGTTLLSRRNDAAGTS